MLLEYELNHDDGPRQVKAMIIDALRFSDQHGMRAPRPRLDEAGLGPAATPGKRCCEDDRDCDSAADRA